MSFDYRVVLSVPKTTDYYAFTIGVLHSAIVSDSRVFEYTAIHKASRTGVISRVTVELRGW
jgi:hypothetical protein